MRAQIEGPIVEQDRKEASKPSARIYAFTKNDAEARSSKFVSGQFPIMKKYACVLFDSRAMYSFVSMKFVDYLDRNKDCMRQDFRTALPSGDVLLSKYRLRDVPIVISELELNVDLIILRMVDYDVILIMDFLPKYRATID